MYRKLHHKLTLLFTCIAGLILVIMSISCLYISKKQLHDNSFFSFSAEMNTLAANFVNQSTLTNEWLTGTASGGKYLMALYDNGTPLTYSKNNLSETQLLHADEAIEYFQQAYRSELTLTNYRSAHKVFSYTSTDRTSYYACYLEVTKNHSELSGVILYSREQLEHQIQLLRIRFILLDISGILLLFLFSFFYTHRLLTPIKSAHEKQAAFIAAASHELRTPLAVILSAISAAKSASGTKKEHFLNTVEKESGRMSELVSDMLTLAKADNHSFSLEMKPVELDTLLLDAYEAFEVLAREKKITLIITLPEESIPPCICDGSRIRQVLSILISNGLTYGNPGGFLKLALTFQGSCFFIQVIDNGPGITEEAKPHIFDRFYRADSSRSAKDHFGLGLCIAKEIVDAHNGTITVTDTAGFGATFCIKLNFSPIPADILLPEDRRQSPPENHWLL